MASHQAGGIETRQSVERQLAGYHKGTSASILHLLLHASTTRRMATQAHHWG